MRVGGRGGDQAAGACAAARHGPQRARLAAGKAKRGPLRPAAASPAGPEAGSAASSLSLALLPPQSRFSHGRLAAASEPCQACLRLSGSLPAVRHPVARGKPSFSARLTRRPSCAALRARLSLPDTAVGRQPFYAVSGTESSLGSVSRWLSGPRSMPGRLRVGSGCPGPPLRLTPWLHSQRREILTS